MYGIKGKIDSTLIIEDQQGIQFETALEIKTGKQKLAAHRGQVLLYSLLLTERFRKSNPSNILLFILDDNVSDLQTFQYIKQTRNELHSLVIVRNELAKWQKRNNAKITESQEFKNKEYTTDRIPMSFHDFLTGTNSENNIQPEELNYDQKLIVWYPPLITRTQECRNCFQNKVCSISALSIEDSYPQIPQRVHPQGQFPIFEEMQHKLTYDVKQYFKKFVECINLEQNAEKKRHIPQNQDCMSHNSVQEYVFLVISIESNLNGGLKVTLEQNITPQTKQTEICVSDYVCMSTINNITFSNGVVVSKETFQKPVVREVFQNFVEIKPQCSDHANNLLLNSFPSMLVNGCNQDSINNKYESANQFQMCIRYVVDFVHLEHANINQQALGGQNPKYLRWTLEVEYLSHFSYAIMRQNLLALCTEDQFLSLQDSIIYLKRPKQVFHDECTLFNEKYKQELFKLNDEQKLCVFKCIQCGINAQSGSNKYHMVLGTPGSGKTTIIVALSQILVKMKQMVLLVSFTNQAIDNVFLRMKASGFNQFIRITNNIATVDEGVRENVKTHHMFETMDQIKQVFENNYIFGTTCLQMNNNMLLCVNGGKFDYCIMEEASQINEPLALGPILLAEKFVMIGDFYQLNPLVKSKLAENKGFAVSLFERLCKKYPENISILKIQYRMNKDIMKLSNSIIYNDFMIHRDQVVADQKVYYPTNVKQVFYQTNYSSKLTWLEGLKSRSVTFLKCDKVILDIDINYRQKYKYQNHTEAALCAIIIDNLKLCKVQSNAITVITPFLDQSILLQEHLKPYGIKQVLTIDKCQGIDCDIVILSCTKQTQDQGILLKDLKRLNVALTRAKKMLIIIGTEKFLKEISPFKRILNKLNDEGWVQEVHLFDDFMKTYLPKDFSFNIGSSQKLSVSNFTIPNDLSRPKNEEQVNFCNPLSFMPIQLESFLITTNQNEFQKQIQFVGGKNGKEVQFSILKNSFGELRLRKEISKLNLPTHVVIKFPDQKTIMNFQVHVDLTKEECDWKGAKYKFTVKVPIQYPYIPPKCYCDTQIYHPNIDVFGKVYLQILDAGWSPVFGIDSIISGLVHLFVQPNLDNSFNHGAASLMKNDMISFKKKVAETLKGGTFDQIPFVKFL